MTETITLYDCYEKNHGPAYMTGTQALVRLLLEQSRLDKDQGINSRGLVSGYPGSPLGGLDLELTRHRGRLDAEGIVFQPAINEELAATALWGAQHIHLYDRPEIDGVFGLWYGKGPGLDRALDALRHANMGGVAPKGGMVLAVGDDPTGKSSTVAYQSEQTLIAAGIPFFYPRSVHDIIPMGLQAFALSRFAGCCVGLKITVDTADASTIVNLDTIRPKITVPDAAGPVHIGRHDPALLRESRLFNLRLPAVERFQLANQIDMSESTKRGKLGIIAVGKATYETRDALQSLGIDDHEAAAIGLFSLVMPWPVNTQSLIDFTRQFDEVLVIEEKRPIVEEQLARAVMNIADRAVISGKKAPDGSTLLPNNGEINHAGLVEVLANRCAANDIPVADHHHDPIPSLPNIATRTPWYCAGCPHNSSTKLPDGEIVGMGIGCHSISGFLTPDEITNYTQMGGEGAFWIGRAPFSSRPHNFQNIGDGTYAHSGYLGVRAAVAAGVNMTFKILYNGAVAMTGGQAIEGSQPPWMISRQLAAEGVVKIAVVSDVPDSFPVYARWASNSQIYHRRDLLAVQQSLKTISGVTAIIYVQSCATELRRKRKRGLIHDKPETIMINSAVCEGCGDCAAKSNCVAIKPVTTPEGEKRQIDQSLCNKDMSCLDGFCPSFVSVRVDTDASPEKSFRALPNDINLPMPSKASDSVCNIFIAGIGGTGVSTLAGILIMAARVNGSDATAVNQTGLSQKNGGVTSQIRLAKKGKLDGYMVRLPTKGAHVLLGCDSVVAANDMVLGLLDRQHSRALLNDNIDPVGVAGVGIGSIVDNTLVMTRLGAVMDPAHITKLKISDLANQVFGSTMPSNIIMLGWAVQKGWIPLSIDAIETALRLNGSAVEVNLAALRWGRLLAHAPEQLFTHITTDATNKKTSFDSAADAIAYFRRSLTNYQNAAYASRFERFITAFTEQLAARNLDVEGLGIRAAQALYRAMAIKDEYEVARLLTDREFTDTIAASAGADAKIAYHLAPPLLGWLKTTEGTPRKFRFGNWLTPWLQQLARMSWLRGSLIDPFGYTAERRRERAYREQVGDWIKTLGERVTTENQNQVEAALDLMIAVRGYGHIRKANLAQSEPQINAIISNLCDQPPPMKIAAE
jgi:indolepyruvate ferredoxin oxidoreductase